MNQVKCKVVMLPTEKATHIVIDEHSNDVMYLKNPNIANFGFQHLYFTTDQKIYTGDTVLHERGWIGKVIETNYNKEEEVRVHWFFEQEYTATQRTSIKYIEKLIATTDSEISIKGRPSDAFLMKYNKSIKFVNVEVIETLSDPDLHDTTTIQKIKVAADGTITITPFVIDLITSLENYLRFEREILRNEFEGCDFHKSILIKREIKGIDRALQFIHQNRTS